MNRELKFKIGTEEVTAHYPNVGEKLEIESKKMLLSKNQYGDLARSSHITGGLMLDIIDAYSYFSVCCPELKLKTEGFFQLSPEMERSFLIAFKGVFIPWLMGVEQELTDLFDEMSKDKVEEK